MHEFPKRAIIRFGEVAHFKKAGHRLMSCFIFGKSTLILHLYYMNKIQITGANNRWLNIKEENL